ncbi:secretory pathway protein Sec39-domain-containing protein [Ephemerocybe angulata]|uniref:Secretory pathway protein Sec39-domain-containing protein n=1 Tax=Ephemerocybe angulata TaxID=980116 RepID=A0A8H6IL01_9AGAR|nr:secretory pathway protein Sec39-domain-containing protein [Tulosesus angulatus]
MTTTASSRWKALTDEELTTDAVYDILGAVPDDVWATAACVDRILEDRNTQHALLVHGISRTDSVLERCKGFLPRDEEESSEEGPSNQELLVQHFHHIPSYAQLCQLRSVLLERLGRLNTYVELEKAAVSAAAEEEEEEVDEELDEWEDDPWAEEGSVQTSKPKRTGKLPFTLAEFLSSALLASARALASGQYFDALGILVRRHNSDLWPFRLDILSFIPEHAQPLAYRRFLPSLDSNTNSELRWSSGQPAPDLDFSQLSSTQAAIQEAGASLELTSPIPEQPLAQQEPLSFSELTEWYTTRVNTIIQTTGMVDVALTLVQHGASQGIPSLDELGEELSLLSRLVYDAPQDPSSPSDWNLDLWRAMEPEAVVRGYLAHSTPESIAGDMTHLVVPYLFVLEAREERAGNPDSGLQERLLHNYILSAPLELAASIFEASKPTLPTAQRILRNDVHVAQLALACLYGSDALDQWPTMSRIFECMPAWETSGQDETDEEAADTTLASLGTFVTPTTNRPKCTPTDLLLFFQPLSFQSLSRALDILDVHLESGEIFARWSVPAPLRWFLQSSDDLKEQTAWATRMARRAGGTVDPLNALEDWEWLLDDMLKLTEKSESGIKGAFGLMSREEIMTIFLSGLLSTGKIDIAKTLLRHPHGKIDLSPQAVEDICLKCSNELYVNASSGNYKVGEMKLAYECLDVPPPTPRIVSEKEFIEATSRICSFHVTSRGGNPISPIEIRLTKDRLSLISSVLSSNNDAYKHTEVMLDLCYKLGFRNDVTAEVKVLAMMADTALQAEDFTRAYDHSQRMVEIIHKLKADAVSTPLASDTKLQEAIEVCWIACFQLGRQPEYDDLGKKMALLGYSLELCPADKMHDVLTAWRRLHKEDIEEREERLTNRDSAIPQSAARPSILDRNGGGGLFGPRNVASSLRARLQDLHMPSPPLLSTPDAAALASRTFKSVASNFPFSIGHRSQGANSDVGHGAASESSRADSRDDVSVQASRALSKGIGWLIGVDE